MAFDSMNPRAELWLTLAKAFLAPAPAPVAAAMREALAGDLGELAGLCGIELGPRCESLRSAFDHIPDDAALLVHYSGLFLVPPVKARLNLGYYLDGSLNGPAHNALGSWHAAYGVARLDDFHDLADHLAALLEFLALLEADERGPGIAAEFAGTLVLPALPHLAADIREAGHGDSPYLHLVDIVEHIGLAFYPQPDAISGRLPRHWRKREWDDTCHCQRCGSPIAREKELAVIAKALKESGLPAEHLSFCPECRDAGRGWNFRPI